MSAADATVVHAYGLVGGHLDALRLPHGLGRARVEVLQLDWAAVLVSDLDAEAYGPEVWRAHGEDPRWLEEVVRDHHTVLQTVAEDGDVLPLRLPGIYDDRAAVQKVLEEQRGTLEDLLARVRGHVELGVKVYLVDRESSPETEERPTSGRDYLARRSAQASSREQARARRQADVLELHESLAGVSSAAAVSPPQDPALSGRDEPMLLNAAYLVRRGDMDGFVGLAERLHEAISGSGLTVEVTGPWPPYSFTDAPDGASAGSSS